MLSAPAPRLQIVFDRTVESRLGLVVEIAGGKLPQLAVIRDTLAAKPLLPTRIGAVADGQILLQIRTVGHRSYTAPLPIANAFRFISTNFCGTQFSIASCH